MPTVFVMLPAFVSIIITEPVGEPAVKRCELLILRALQLNDVLAQRRLVRAAITEFANGGDLAAHGLRQRIALTAGLFIQVSSDWNSRITMVKLFRDLTGADALAGLASIRELLNDAEVIDAELAKKQTLGKSGGTATGYLEAILDRITDAVPRVRNFQLPPRGK